MKALMINTLSSGKHSGAGKCRLASGTAEGSGLKSGSVKTHKTVYFKTNVSDLSLHILSLHKRRSLYRSFTLHPPPDFIPGR